MPGQAWGRTRVSMGWARQLHATCVVRACVRACAALRLRLCALRGEDQGG